MPDCYLQVAAETAVEKSHEKALEDIRECAKTCHNGHVRKEKQGDGFVEAWVEYRTVAECEECRPKLKKCLQDKHNRVLKARCE